ncbi:DUF3159 domain-containing protein [Kitasatospora sp. NPDC058965]|uniref:DUF3159 domain-containing protein n=1 Tax=Kitasatospora sp. NPDC058965 TaxID=3346682 RepID=UPI0036A95707
MTDQPGGDYAAPHALITEEPGGTPGQELDAASRKAAEDAAASREAADTVMAAFGGVRGLIDTTVPGLVFIATFTVTHQVSAAAWAAVGLCLLLVLVRLLRRETVKHAFSGVFGVAIGAFFAMRTGKAQNFYLPGLLYSVGYCLALAVSALVRWPLIGVMLGPVTGEMFTWRTQNPGRLKAYTKATWAWVAIMSIKPLVLFPLYFTGDANLLGWLKVALAYPPLLLAMYVTWQILVKAPPPIKAAVPDEDE